MRSERKRRSGSIGRSGCLTAITLGHEAEIRKALDTRDWQEANTIVREWEADASLPVFTDSSESITLDRGWERFLADMRLEISNLQRFVSTGCFRGKCNSSLVSKDFDFSNNSTLPHSMSFDLPGMMDQCHRPRNWNAFVRFFGLLKNENGSPKTQLAN